MPAFIDYFNNANIDLRIFISLTLKRVETWMYTIYLHFELVTWKALWKLQVKQDYVMYEIGNS